MRWPAALQISLVRITTGSMKTFITLKSSVVVFLGYIASSALGAAADGPAVSPAANVAAPVSHVNVPRPWVAAEGSRLAKANNLSLESVKRVARQKLAVKGVSPADPDVEALAVQLLQQANQAAEADLKQIQAEMKAAAERKKAQRESQQKMKEAKDNLAEASAADQMHLQQAMDRKAKLEQLLSQLMKKASDTSQAVTGNLK